MPSDLKSDLLGLIPSLRAFAFCLTQDQLVADALVHSALGEIWSKHATQGNRNLKAAAFGIVHGRFRKDISRASLLRRVSSECPATPGDGFAACFSALPRSLRAAISLVGAWGFSPCQAAEICSCNVETIDHRVATACRKLAKALARPRAAQTNGVATNVFSNTLTTSRALPVNFCGHRKHG